MAEKGAGMVGDLCIDGMLACLTLGSEKVQLTAFDFENKHKRGVELAMTWGIAAMGWDGTADLTAGCKALS